jgi:hypothetical protein
MEGPGKVDSYLTPKRGWESVFLGVRGLAGRVLAVTGVTTKSKDSNRKKAGVVKYKPGPTWRVNYYIHMKYKGI